MGGAAVEQSILGDGGDVRGLMVISPIELVLGLFVVAVALAYLARRIAVAYPILLVLGGLVLGAFGFYLGFPSIILDPDVIFLLLLPPILFGAGFSTPIRDFKANARPIGLLAVGLVLFTTVVVGLVAIALIPGINVGAAFTLGAIVAPPDAVAATAIFRRLGVPRRVVTILEGESLINDATALIAYRFAVILAIEGVFSFADAGFSFIYAATVGVVVGIVVGFLLTEGWRRTSDPTLEIMVSLLAPFAAYLPAEALGASGVLAAVVAGLIAGRRAARVLSPDGRLIGRGVWDIVIFIINSLAFMLIGLQLPSILERLTLPTSTLIAYALIISLTVIVARFVWVFPATYLPRMLSKRIRTRDPSPPPQAVVVISWAGMRGAVSLAAALALSLVFPDRDLVIFLTFCVILATLVGQGLTLPGLVRRLGVVATTGPDTEDSHARLVAVEAALRRLDDLEVEYPGHRELVDQLRSRFEHEAGHVWPTTEGPLDESEQELLDHLEIRTAVLDAERDAVIGLRDDGVIGDDVLHRIERDLDLEALRSGV
ncbi:MAG: Na+/H+ antiporter [Chloroflexota bacterium]